MRSIVKEQSWAASILFTIYALSFLLPALGHGDRVFGWQAFLMGMIYCWALPWTIAWWANVFFWLGLMALSCHQYGKAAILGLIALLLGLSVLCNEVGNRPQVGYFIWIGSMAGLLLTAIGKAVKAEAERSDLSPLVGNRSLGLGSEYLRHEPCERIAAGPPPDRLVEELHIREQRKHSLTEEVIESARPSGKLASILGLGPPDLLAKGNVTRNE